MTNKKHIGNGRWVDLQRLDRTTGGTVVGGRAGSISHAVGFGREGEFLEVVDVVVLVGGDLGIDLSSHTRHYRHNFQTQMILFRRGSVFFTNTYKLYAKITWGSNFRSLRLHQRKSDLKSFFRYPVNEGALTENSDSSASAPSLVG